MAGDLLNHVRNCIRNDLKECLMGCKYFSVYCGAMERYCSPDHVSKKKAAVNIRLGNEVVDQKRSGAIGGNCATGPKLHKLEVILEVYAVGCEDVEYFLDSVCAEVQQKMCNCISAGGVCHSMVYQGTTTQRADIGDKDFHLCRVIYEASYMADPCDMSQYKPFGCK